MSRNEDRSKETFGRRVRRFFSVRQIPSCSTRRADQQSFIRQYRRRTMVEFRIDLSAGANLGSGKLLP